MIQENIDTFGLNLTIDERKSYVWAKIYNKLLADRDKLRTSNDRLENSFEETLAIRAQLAVINRILAAGELPGQEEVAAEPRPDSLIADQLGGHWSE